MNNLVCGVGINDLRSLTSTTIEIGEGGKRRRKTTWRCPFYAVWVDMLKRGYSKNLKARYPSYIGVEVCDEWLTFSNFKRWMEQQDWAGKQLDKDLLVRGNKIYSPTTCIFVSKQVNTFLLECTAARGLYLIGVSWHSRDHKFTARCQNPFSGKRESLGYFDSEQDAHQAWLAKKLEHATKLSLLQEDERVAAALVERYTHYAQGDL